MAFSARSSNRSHKGELSTSRSTTALGRSYSGVGSPKPTSPLTRALTARQHDSPPSPKGQTDDPRIRSSSVHFADSAIEKRSRSLAQSLQAPSPTYSSLRPPVSWERGGTLNRHSTMRDQSPNWQFHLGDNRQHSRYMTSSDLGGFMRAGVRDDSNFNNKMGLSSSRSTHNLGRSHTNLDSQQSQLGFQTLDRKSTAKVHSPGADSMATTDTGGVRSPQSARPGRARRMYSSGGSTIVFDEPPVNPRRIPGKEQRMDPKEFGVPMRKWEQRMFGSMPEEAAEERALRAEKQAHDESLTDAFGFTNRECSPRAPNGEGSVKHRNMRTAFTDRALQRAHMHGHVQLGSPEECAETAANVWSCSEPSCKQSDLPPAGSTSWQAAKSRTANARFADAAAPEMSNFGKGCSAHSAEGFSSQKVWKSMSYGEEPEQRRQDVQQYEQLLRKEMGHRRRGEMSPLAVERERARSVDSGFAGNVSRRSNFEHATIRPESAGDRGFACQNVAVVTKRGRQDWQDKLQPSVVARCLSPRATTCDEDAASVATSTNVQYILGSSPASDYFGHSRGPGSGRALRQTHGRQCHSRPDFWFEPSACIGTRRMGRGEDHSPSAEAVWHSVNRDAESQLNFRFELESCGEARQGRRAVSQPPARNPLSHEGACGSSDLGVMQRGDRKAAGRSNKSHHADYLLNHEAIADEEKRIQNSRMAMEPEFSRLCAATSEQAHCRSQEVAQVICRNHRHKSSNMAMLLTWE